MYIHKLAAICTHDLNSIRACQSGGISICKYIVNRFKSTHNYVIAYTCFGSFNIGYDSRVFTNLSDHVHIVIHDSSKSGLNVPSLPFHGILSILHGFICRCLVAHCDSNHKGNDCNAEHYCNKSCLDAVHKTDV